MSRARHAIFNAADCGADLSVEDGGLELTTTANALSTARLCRGTVFLSAYLSDVEFLAYGDDADIADVVVGVASADAGLATVLGGDAYGIGYDPATGEVKFNGAVLTTLGTALIGDSITVVLDQRDAAAPTVTIWVDGNALGTVAVPAGLIGEPLAWAASLGSTDAGDVRLQALSGQRDSKFPISGSTGFWEPRSAVPTARLATVDYISAPADSPANTRFEGIIAAEALQRSFGVHFWVDGDRSSIVPSSAVLIVNDGKGRLAEWIRRDVTDVPVVLTRFERGSTLAAGVPAGRFYIEEVEDLGNGRKQFVLRGDIPELSEPLQRRLISPDSIEEARNRPEPVLFGAGLSLEPVKVDEVDERYLVSDRTLGKLTKIRDAGDPFNPATDYTVELGGRSFVLTSPPYGIVTLDASSSGEGISGSGEILTSGGLLRWDDVSDVTVSGDQLRFGDSYTSGGGAIESWVRKLGAIAAGKSYRLTFNWTGRRGFFGGTGQIQYLEVSWSTTDGGVWWKWLGAPGLHVIEIVNTSGVARDLVIRMTGTGAANDWCEIEDASFSLVEIVQEEQDEDALDPMPFAELFANVAARKKLPASRWNAAEAEALDTDSAHEGIGYYTRDQVPASDPIELALPGYTASMWIDRSGTVRFARLVAPEDVPEVDWAGDIDWDVIGLSPLRVEQDPAKGLTMAMATTRNWKVLDDSQLSTDSVDVTLRYRQQVSRKHRHVLRYGGPLSPRYQRHAELADAVETILHRKADGQREINRVAPIFAIPRFKYRGTLPLNLDYEPMKVYRLRSRKSEHTWLHDWIPVHFRHVQDNEGARTCEVVLWGKGGDDE